MSPADHHCPGMSLGFLDLCKRGPNQLARDAVRDTIALARAADEFGLLRYWLAEHHVDSSSITAPETLVGLLCETTRALRIGFGGVVLRYYSPWKVAEILRSLQAIAGDRIDLGLCRGPGLVDPRVATELVENNQWELEDSVFDRKVAKTVRLVAVEATASSLPLVRPAFKKVDTWLLSSSQHGARLAAGLDMNLAVPLFIMRDVARAAATIAAYRAHRPTHPGRTALAISMVGSFTHDDAVRRHRRDVAAGSFESNLVGSYDDIFHRLRRTAELCGTDEVLMTTFSFDHEERMADLKELASRWRGLGLAGPA